MPDLRSAIVHLTGLACDWTPAEAAHLAGVTEIAAVRYLHTLRAAKVVAYTSESPERYRAGHAAPKWRRARPNTKPGGGASSYKRAKELREALATRDWKARTGKEPAPALLTTPEGHGGVQSTPEYAGGELMQMATLLTRAEAADVLRVTPKGLDKMMRRLGVRKIMVGRLVRVRADDIAQIMGGGNAKTNAG